MIRTEASRHELQSFKTFTDEVVLKALKDFDKDLELLWDDDNHSWQFYRVKTHGVIPSQDVLCWQVTPPSNDINKSIVKWLQKYDTTNGGYKDQDDLRSDFMKMFTNANYASEQARLKRAHETELIKEQIVDEFLIRRKVSVAVPNTDVVGYNPITGRCVRAVKKSKPTDPAIVRKIKAHQKIWE